MKYIKYLIIFFVIIIVILSLLLFVVLNNNSNNTGNNIVNNSIENTTINPGTSNLIVNDVYKEPVENNEYPVDIQYDKKLSYVKVRSDYYTISSLYEKYINKIADKDKTWLKNTLSPNYITTYNITDDNIFSKLTVPAKQSSYKTNITEMLTTQIDSTTYIYIVKGKCRVVGNNNIFSVQVMFEVNRSNKTYNIYPYQYIQDKGIDQLKEGDILNNYNKEEIVNKKDNTFSFVMKSDVEVATEYFNNYKELIQFYPDEAYSKLNTEYAQKRFGNIQNFKNYLKANSEVLLNMEINMYKVYSTQDYTDYICADKYDNLYIFRQQGGIMRYTAYLDNYTVLTDSYAKEYNELDKFDKSKYNLTKFINMVNTKDYAAIYNVLDKTFRANNFKTQADLENAIKNNMYSLNKIKIEDLDNENYEYYVFEIRLINIKDENQSKLMTVIINQGEGTDFTMSFSF